MSSYTQSIKTVEESLRLVENQIDIVKKSDTIDESKLQNLNESRNKYIIRLRDLRRAEYEESQSVDYGDDR
jgi:conjugal transfer/entry exclusion protein